LSLIELLVAMAIGLTITLAITRVMISFEGSKRTSTAVNDTIQSGAYASFILDRSIRSAGTGYTQRLSDMFGCRLNVRRASATPPTVLPPASAFPGAFANASLVRRLAPVLVEQDAANASGEIRGDIITVMSGAGGKSELPLSVPAVSITVAPTPSFSLPLTIEYKTGDLVLIGGDVPPSIMPPRPVTSRECMVQQVQGAISGTLLPLGGDYYSDTGTTINLITLGTSGSIYAAQIGNLTTAVPNGPLFQMFGVGDGATLFSYDLLQTGATAAANLPQPISDNVVEVRALYGLDLDFNHRIDRWQNPGVAPFRYADLTDGSTTALANLKQIMAIRLGVVLRSPIAETTAVSASPVMFTDITDAGGNSLERTRTLSVADQAYRYRVVEMTIPLRNMQFAPLP